MIELNISKESGGMLYTIKDIDFNATIECDSDCFYRESKVSKCSRLKDYRKRGIHCPYFKIHCISVRMNIKNISATPSGKLPEPDSLILIDDKGYTYKFQVLCEDNLPPDYSDYWDDITINTQADYFLIFPHPRDGRFPDKLRVYNRHVICGEQFIDFSISDSSSELEQWIKDIKESTQS